MERKGIEKEVAELTARAEQTDKETEETIKNQLTVREHLLKRKRNAIVQIKLNDGEDDFVIETMLLSPKEQTDIISLQIKMATFKRRILKAKTDKQVADIARKSTELLSQFYGWAGKVCIDPELNEEYWQAGKDFTIDVPLQIIRETLAASQQSRQDLICFRKK